MSGQTNRSILGPKLQRRLRNDPTEAEKCLWRRLRNRQIEGCKFRRQHPFGDYILDFACLERSVAIELDGGQHTETADADRTTFLENAGFRILRFWNSDVFGDLDGVLEVIRENLISRAKPSPPNPPLEGEG